MEREQAIEYRQTLSDILKMEPDKRNRRVFLAAERITEEYKLTRRIIHPPIISEELNGETSQIGVLVDNPLSSLSSSERELTPQEQTIIWANQVLEEYTNLSQQTSEGRKKARDLVIKTAGRLLQNSQEIDVAGSVWKSRSIPEGEEPVKESFYSLVQKRCAKEAHDHWENIQPGQLADWVRIYAQNRMITDFISSMLSAYFRGPQNRRERVEALYRFTYGSLDLVDNPSVLEEAVKIGQFQTEILPLGSDLQMDFLVAVQTTIDNDALLQKALNIDEIMFNLYRLTTLNGAQIRESIKKHFYDTNRLQDGIAREMDRMVKRLGYAEALRRSTALTRLNNTTFVTHPTSLSELPWPFTLKNDFKEPLRKKYAQVARAFIAASQSREQIEGWLISRGIIENPVSLSLPRPDGYVFDIIVPGSLFEDREKKTAILDKALSDTALQRSLEDLPQDPLGTSVAVNYFRFEGLPIVYFLRIASGFEQNRHPLQALEAIGYPSPDISLQEMIGVNQKLRTEILRRQIRFFNKRGVRIPLQVKDLRRLGYRQIDFHKDPFDAEQTIVRFHVLNTPYTVKLDRYLNLDFEGKRFDNPHLRESLHYILLSILTPLLCEERIKSPDGIDVEEREIVSRMGHLRLLPEGLHYTSEAVKNCLLYEGKDLVVIDTTRQQDLGTSRHTTYVKPIIEKEENLPPITIHLPKALTFSQKKS